MLADPHAADDEQNRMKKVEVSYALSHRHLSESARRLFERLSKLPGGVWCGEPAALLPWDKLLGEGWREPIEKELNYYALLRWEPDGGDGASGCYVMLPSLLEFARRKYRDAHAGWEPGWMRGWLETVQTWNGLLSGRSPDVPGTAEQRAAFGRLARQLGARLFENPSELARGLRARIPSILREAPGLLYEAPSSASARAIKMCRPFRA